MTHRLKPPLKSHKNTLVQNGSVSLEAKIAADPALWAEIHEAAIRTIEELRARLRLHE